MPPRAGGIELAMQGPQQPRRSRGRAGWKNTPAAAGRRPFPFMRNGEVRITNKKTMRYIQSLPYTRAREVGFFCTHPPPRRHSLGN